MSKASEKCIVTVNRICQKFTVMMHSNGLMNREKQTTILHKKEAKFKNAKPIPAEFFIK